MIHYPIEEVDRKQLGFLGSIGSSEAEQEVKRRVETVTKNFIDKMQEDTGVATSLDENEIRVTFKP